MAAAPGNRSAIIDWLCKDAWHVIASFFGGLQVSPAYADLWMEESRQLFAANGITAVGLPQKGHRRLEVDIVVDVNNIGTQLTSLVMHIIQ